MVRFNAAVFLRSVLHVNGRSCYTDKLMMLEDLLCPLMSTLSFNVYSVYSVSPGWLGSNGHFRSDGLGESINQCTDIASI